MKSVAIKGVKEFEIKEIDEPIIDHKHVIIDVLKAGICGSDIHNYESGNPVGLVMGHEFCGIVRDPGDRSDLTVGDKVTALPISPCGECEACRSGNHQYCASTWTHAVGLALDNPGAFTRRIAVRSDMVVKVDAQADPKAIAMVEPTAVGLHAIHLADIKIGDKVLVVGGGIIGLVSAMLAKKEGASSVIVSETNPNRGKKAVDLGVADAWLDAREEGFLTKAQTISGAGFDVVIECCGNAPAVSSAIMAAKAGGKVILVGVATAPISIPTVVAVMREIELKGAIAYTIDEFKTCAELIANGRLDVLKFVDREVGLDDVQAAFDDLYSGNSTAVKIIVDPNK